MINFIVILHVYVNYIVYYIIYKLNLMFLLIIIYNNVIIKMWEKLTDEIVP